MTIVVRFTVFPCRYYTYLEQRTQSPSTKTSTKNRVLSNLTERIFFLRQYQNSTYDNRETAFHFLIPVICGSFSFQLRPLKSSLGRARKFSVPVRRKETLFSWIFAQTIMMLCEFAWTFCLLVFSMSGSTGKGLFLSVLLFFL